MTFPKSRFRSILPYFAAILFLYPYVFFIRIGIQVPLFAFLLLPLFAVSAASFRSLHIDNELIKIGILYLGLFALTCLYFLKPGNDAWYLTMFWGLRIAFLLYAVLFVFCFKKIFRWTAENFVTAIVISFIAHGFIAWVGFYSPSVRNYLFEIQHMSSVARQALAISDFIYRLPTFGMMFFGSGVLYASCLVLIFKKIEAAPKSILRWVLFFAVFLTGMSISRTTIIGLPIIATLAILSASRRQILFYGLASTVGFLIFLLGLESFEKTKPVTHWIAEPIFSFAQHGRFTTGSTEETIETAQKVIEEISEPTDDTPAPAFQSAESGPHIDGSQTPSSLTTGSGRLFSHDGNSYFGGTDVGYLRLLLFGGAGYLLFFFFPSFMITFYGFFNLRIKPHRAAIIGIFIIQMVANLKGLVELSSLLILIFVILAMDVNHEVRTVY